MENRELENKISSVICDMVPADSFDKISERIATGDVPERSNVKMNNGSKVKRVLFPVAAACIFLIVSVVFGLTYYGNNYAVAAVIDIDVNPSIELSINKKEKVLDVVALNDDAKALIEGMPFDKRDVNDVVDAIMSKLIEAGYVVSDDENGILITVQNKDIKEADRIRSKVVDKIDKHLMDKNIDADVMGQSLSDVNEAKEFAEKNNISVGRAMFIKKLSEKHDDINPEELADMPMKDIVREVKHKNIKLEGIVDCGHKGDKHEDGKPEADKNEEKPGSEVPPIDVKISEEEAKNIAVADAGADAEVAVFKMVKLDVKKDVPVYKLILCVGETVYHYEINADDGTVIKSETETADEFFDKIPEERPEKPSGENEKGDRPVNGDAPAQGNKPVEGESSKPEIRPDGETVKPENSTDNKKPVYPERNPVESAKPQTEKQEGEVYPGYQGGRN